MNAIHQIIRTRLIDKLSKSNSSTDVAIGMIKVQNLQEIQSGVITCTAITNHHGKILTSPRRIIAFFGNDGVSIRANDTSGTWLARVCYSQC
ncbi:hypothetical protein A1QO_04280 [Vibrio genomosp. F10 str. ZF-129]|uniref:Uncharacterized protein n=1 Tax=Vibrio genomosp. F10 str. ZF-129 TaxID=1187848 RepID=A0A1E5BIV3_9VIBR|nr:hypothetical protein [Vibrio genomosp. F10]OEE37330.1 hypothetical protein A1QO_04280 [Vibrio genomosp. F10 str. ZF-129]